MSARRKDERQVAGDGVPCSRFLSRLNLDFVFYFNWSFA